MCMEIYSKSFRKNKIRDFCKDTVHDIIFNTVCFWHKYFNNGCNWTKSTRSKIQSIYNFYPIPFRIISSRAGLSNLWPAGFFEAKSAFLLVFFKKKVCLKIYRHLCNFSKSGPQPDIRATFLALLENRLDSPDLEWHILRWHIL